MLGGGFEFFHDARGRADGAPAHAVLARHHQAAIQCFGVGKDFREHISLRSGVVGVQQGRADGHREFLLPRQRVHQLEEVHRLLRIHALDVFRERLGGDANGLDLVAARLESNLRAAEHFQRLGDLPLIVVPNQVNERSDGANLGIRGIDSSWRGALLSRSMFRPRFCGARRNARRENGKSEKRNKSESSSRLHGHSPARHDTSRPARLQVSCPVLLFKARGCLKMRPYAPSAFLAFGRVCDSRRCSVGGSYIVVLGQAHGSTLQRVDHAVSRKTSAHF